LPSFEKLVDSLKKVKNPKWSLVKIVSLVCLSGHHVQSWNITFILT
jgi:hypothetical protein